MSQQALSVGRPSNSLHFIVGEMSGKLDQVLMALLDDRKASAGKFEAVDRRLEVLERWRWRIVGGGSVVVFLLGSVEVFRYVAGK
jgi:hypothetical protein